MKTVRSVWRIEIRETEKGQRIFFKKMRDREYRKIKREMRQILLVCSGCSGLFWFGLFRGRYCFQR